MDLRGPTKLTASLSFAAACLYLGIALVSLAWGREAFVGAQGSASADSPPAAAPYRPALAPAGEQAPGTPASSQPLTASRPVASWEDLDLLDRGEFAAAAGRFAEAEALWRQALAQRPDWTTVKHRLAELPARRTSFASDLAQQEMRRQARLALVEGVSHFNARQYQEAAQHFQHYLAVFPDDAQARSYLDLALGQGASLQAGSLRVISQPPAEVLLDGLLVGHTPMTLPQVSKGSHQMEVRSHGGSQVKTLEIRDGGQTEVSFRLLGGFVAVNAQPWAEVLLDGELVGQTPLTLENLVLGAHQVSARHPDMPEQTRQVFLQAGQTQALHFNLSPQ